MLNTRLKQLLAERGLSINEFAELCDLPLETVRNIYYGKTTDPKLSTAVKMAEALGMNVNCLIAKCPHTAEERTIIHNYRSCGNHGKALIALSAKYQASAAKAEKENKEKRKIRCFIPQSEMGNGVIYEACEIVEIETSVKEAYVAIQITGNNLAPSFCKKDIVLFENRFPRNGEVAAFLKGNKVYIRKFIEKEDGYLLKCLHDWGEDIPLKRMDEVDYIGTAIDVVR